MLLGFTMFIGGIMVKSWAIFAFHKWIASKKTVSSTPDARGKRCTTTYIYSVMHKAYSSLSQAINEEWKPNVWIWLLITIMGVCAVVWTVTFDTTTTYTVRANTFFSNHSFRTGNIYMCIKWHVEIINALQDMQPILDVLQFIQM
jgi:hypothetical protein